MITLSPETDQRLRSEVNFRYHGMIGGMSIFFEDLIRNFFDSQQHIAAPALLYGPKVNYVKPNNKIVLRSLCSAQLCGRYFSVGELYISVAGNYRGQLDKYYHLACYTDAKGKPIYDTNNSLQEPSIEVQSE